MTSRLAWFITPAGKRATSAIAASTACATCAISFLPQTIFLDEFRDFVQMCKYNKPIVIQPQIRKLWDTVLNDLNIGEFKKKLVKPFTVFGFDVWHAGSLESRFGSIIGLPISFTYTDFQKVKKEVIMINDEPLDWNREDAEQLIKNVMLSDKAKKYAMAREILMTNNNHIFFKTIANSSIVCAHYVIATVMNEKFKMFEKPRAIRVFMYLVIGVFSWGVWSIQNDAITRYFEHHTDEKLSRLGVEYIEGAIEFYNKTLKRNVAIRSLSGSMAESAYTDEGNEANIIRMGKLPLTYRRQFFENKLKAQNPEILEGTVVSNSEKLYVS